VDPPDRAGSHRNQSDHQLTCGVSVLVASV
jgi:hypothetical protein